MQLDALPTPALVLDRGALERNLALMATRLPGSHLRPHVKAHKCTALAARQVAVGHSFFTCATPREVIGMAGAGVGAHLLLANEVVDIDRLMAAVVACDAASIGFAVAVDSPETVVAAQRAGVREVVVDVDVGLPRCGVAPEQARVLADLARSSGLEVAGVMGYEGHLQMVENPTDRADRVASAMSLLRRAHDDVGGTIVSAGGTGTHLSHTIGLDHPTGVTDVQAGSYALMDTQYSTLGQGFEQALHIVGTVISTSGRRAVADVGLKSLGMDHGDPSINGATVWFCSDEHITFAPADGQRLRVGDRVRILPAHVDPTVARHETMWVVDNDEVVDRWEIDLRHW